MAGESPSLVSSLRAAVAERVGSSRFNLWFGEGVHLEVEGDTLGVDVPNTFFREWIQSHFAASLLEAGQAITGRRLQLEVRVYDEVDVPSAGVVEAAPAGQSGPLVKIPANVPVQASGSPDRARVLNRPVRRLEDFIVGPGNRLAHAAAVEMVAAMGAAFNPLVIYGGVGLGKSHLLEGIGHGFRARHPGLRLLQITAEAFTNSFLDALRVGALPSFRARVRGAGVLIVDDVHFVAAKRATQDEFLHTFNTLSDDGVPIILAADQHPRLIAKLLEELTTRFLGGMVVKLEPPDLMTRRAILTAKATARGVEIPDPVVAYVAEHLRGSIRELEGALHTLIANATLTGKRLDLALARFALRDTIRHTAQAIALKDVEKAVCQLFQVEAESLKSDTRARSLAYPRMLAMYLARKHTGAAYAEIGRYFGGRNHSTVISAERKVKGWLHDEEQSALLAGFETASEILSALERLLGT